MQRKNDMEMLFSLYPQSPLGNFIIAAIFFAGYWLLRASPSVYGRGLWLPAIAWLVAALWELVITLFSPEANIRVDLLVIIPLLLLLSLWGIVRAFLWHPA